MFDGLFIDIASARRGEFNRRYAQPGLLAPMMPEYGPPYDSASLLARQRSRGGVPKIIVTNSAAEYWRGDGALVHQDPVTGADLPEDPDVRVYLISGTDHIDAAPLIKGQAPVANPPHNLDPLPVHRALLAHLQDWVQGAPRAALVSAVDDAGNERAGIRLPAVQAGVAAYTGWNPRRHADGLPDVLFDLFGSRLPRRSGPAPGPAELRRAAEDLVEQRFLLPADLALATQQALAELSGP